MNTDLRQYAERCPAFIYPLILRLRQPHPDLTRDQVRDMIHRIALSIPDVTRLRHLLDPDGTGAYDEFYPRRDAGSSISTNAAIDTFLSTYGHDDPAETELINRMIFNPVPADYALTLEHEDDSPVPAPASPDDTLIDTFVRTHSDGSGAASASASADPEPIAPSTRDNSGSGVPPGSLLSESLAKIFIRQGNYRQAHEIIRSLSLNYPEKSIYFADQLRFLRKLIIIQDVKRTGNRRQQNRK